MTQVQRFDTQSSLRPGGTRLVVVVVVIAVVVCLFISCPLMHDRRRSETLRCSVCSDNLLKIHVALDTYHQVYGQLPPQYVTDADGRPLLSWRVLILPFLEKQEQALFEDFRLDERWDGPNNAKLLRYMPTVFCCPSEVRNNSWTTSYVMLVQPESVPSANGATAEGEGDVVWQDQPFIVEVSGLHIAWSEPGDLSASTLIRLTAIPPDPLFPRNHGNRLHVLFRDGLVTSWDVRDLSR